MFVGNPPQKLRAIYDTGSTNTWVLNKKTEVKNKGKKMFSYDESKSCSYKKTPQTARIKFGSGSL